MKDKTQSLYHERILTALLHIQSHLDDKLSLESLAARTYFSPIHFHRIFKGMMGETVVEHVRRIRLERAAHRLAAATSSVTEAAFDAGYETVESFSRAFKKVFDCPPSKYQAHHWGKLYQKLPGEIHYLPEKERTGLIIKTNEDTIMDVKIETVKPMQVAFVRHTGPYNECKKAWDSLCEWAAPKELLQKEAKYLGVGHDDPQVTPPDKIRYDACITVDDSVKAEGNVGIQTVGGGNYAVTTHQGPYENLEATYAELMGKWLPQSGQQMGDNLCFEMYLNDPEQTPPDELLTAIYISIK